MNTRAAGLHLQPFERAGRGFGPTASGAASKVAGTGIQVGTAILSGLFSPAVAIPLNVIGVLAEPTLKYLADRSQVGSDLSLGPFLPETPPESIENLSRIQFQRARERYESDPVARAFADNITVKAALGSNLGISEAAATSQLPADIQALVLCGSSSAPPDSEAMHRLTMTIEKRFDTLSKRIDDLRTLMTTPDLGAEERKRALAQAQADVAWTSHELQGAGAIATFILQNIVNDPSSAKAVSTIFSSVQQVYSAASLFNLGQIGTLALSGSLIGAVSALMSLGQPGADEQILNALHVIDQKLDQIRSQLNVIELQQLDILEGLNKILQNLHLNQAELVRRLATLSSRVDQLSTDITTALREKDITLLGNSIDQCRTLLGAPPPYSAGWAEKYASYLTSFFSHATRAAKQSIFTGGDQDLSSSDTLCKIGRTRATADLFCGYIPQLAALVGVSFQSVDASNTGSSIPNPIEWARGTNAYLEASTLSIRNCRTSCFHNAKVRPPAMPQSVK